MNDSSCNMHPPIQNLRWACALSDNFSGNLVSHRILWGFPAPTTGVIPSHKLDLPRPAHLSYPILSARVIPTHLLEIPRPVRCRYPTLPLKLFHPVRLSYPTRPLEIYPNPCARVFWVSSPFFSQNSTTESTTDKQRQENALCNVSCAYSLFTQDHGSRGAIWLIIAADTPLS